MRLFVHPSVFISGGKSGSLVADHFDPARVHLQRRDVTLVCASRAPMENLLAYRERMGRIFPWISSRHNSFNHDYGAYFSTQEHGRGLAIYNYESHPYPLTDLPGLSAFSHYRVRRRHTRQQFPQATQMSTIDPRLTLQFHPHGSIDRRSRSDGAP